MELFQENRKVNLFHALSVSRQKDIFCLFLTHVLPTQLGLLIAMESVWELGLTLKSLVAIAHRLGQRVLSDNHPQKQGQLLPCKPQ